MNFFDIRKLQAALSMVRVAFLKNNIDIDDVTLQTYLKSFQSAHVTPDDFSVDKIDLDLLLKASESKQIAAHQEEIAVAIQKAIMETINAMIANGTIKAGAKINKSEVIDAVSVEVRALLNRQGIKYENLLAHVWKSIRAEFGDGEFITLVPFEKVVSCVWDSVRTEFKDYDLATIVPLEKILAYAWNSVRTEFKDSSFITTIPFEKMLAYAWESVRTEFANNGLTTVVPFETIETNAWNALRTEFNNNNYVTVVPLTSLATDAFGSEPLSGNVQYDISVKSPYARTAESTPTKSDRILLAIDGSASARTANSFDIKSGVVGIAESTPGYYIDQVPPQDIAASTLKSRVDVGGFIFESISGYLADCKSLIAKADVNFITGLVGSSSLSGALNIKLSAEIGLTPYAIAELLANLGVETVLTSKANVYDSKALDFSLMSLSDIFENADVECAQANGIGASPMTSIFKIISQAEVSAKNAVSSNPSPFEAGTTIYAFVDDVSANAISAMFGLLFRTQVTAYVADSAVRSVCDTDFDADLVTHVSLPSSAVLLSKQLDPEIRIQCRLGGEIIKEIGDYKNCYLDEMNNKKLGSLYKEEF